MDVNISRMMDDAPITNLKGNIFINSILGKQRSKREAELNTNRPNPGGHERKILTKLMNAEKNNQAANNKT